VLKIDYRAKVGNPPAMEARYTTDTLFARYDTLLARYDTLLARYVTLLTRFLHASSTFWSQLEIAWK
jgi:hypothetical protein